MSDDDIYNTESVLESLTKTLLYEGYSLYPYYRSSIKNQKPIPFGVIFPADYNMHNEHSHPAVQSQTILTAAHDATVNITVRFLHLRKTEVLQKNNSDYIPVYDLEINGAIYQSGWQTIERKISTGDLRISELIKKRIIPFGFDNLHAGEIIFNEKKEIEAKRIVTVSEIKGSISVNVDELNVNPGLFRLTVTAINVTPVENAGMMTRDDAFLRSFLSTHIILQTTGGEFISHQDTPGKWKGAVATCSNINTWPILINKSNTTLLSSPIILYDYPEINAQSSGDLFDSTEIEEALLLHVKMLSEDEKKRIGSGDEKLQAMLNKVSGMTPEDLNIYHSMMKSSAAG